MYYDEMPLKRDKTWFMVVRNQAKSLSSKLSIKWVSPLSSLRVLYNEERNTATLSSGYHSNNVEEFMFLVIFTKAFCRRPDARNMKNDFNASPTCSSDILFLPSAWYLIKVFNNWRRKQFFRLKRIPHQFSMMTRRELSMSIINY